jgi:sugar phosphate isomerase/epimerase
VRRRATRPSGETFANGRTSDDGAFPDRLDVHARLTVLATVFRGATTLEEDLAAFAQAGAHRVGLNAAKLQEAGVEAGLASVVHSGLEVTHLLHAPLVPLAEPGRLAEAQESLLRSLDLAAAVGARSVYGPTGGAPSLDWDEAASAFASAIAPAVIHARSRGVRLLTEPTISLVADLSVLHTLADTVELCERTGLGVCLDVQHCWHERDLRGAIRRAAPHLGLVQLSDWIPGNRHHFRAVPGDGAIPLERILGWILEEGYDGLVDLELYPEPGVPEPETIERAIERATMLLERLGC